MKESNIIKKLKLLQKFHSTSDARLEVNFVDEKLYGKNLQYFHENLDVDDLVNWVLDDGVTFKLFVKTETEFIL